MKEKTGDVPSIVNMRTSVPASFFAIVLGLVGLGNDWGSATLLWGAPPWIGEGIMTVACVVWGVLLVLHALKWLQARDEALAELASIRPSWRTEM